MWPMGLWLLYIVLLNISEFNKLLLILNLDFEYVSYSLTLELNSPNIREPPHVKCTTHTPRCTARAHRVVENPISRWSASFYNFDVKFPKIISWIPIGQVWQISCDFISKERIANRDTRQPDLFLLVSSATVSLFEMKMPEKHVAILKRATKKSLFLRWYAIK